MTAILHPDRPPRLTRSRNNGYPLDQFTPRDPVGAPPRRAGPGTTPTDRPGGDPRGRRPPVRRVRRGRRASLGVGLQLAPARPPPGHVRLDGPGDHGRVPPAV